MQKTTSVKNTFRDCRSKVNVTGLVGDLGTKMAVTLPILGLSRWNKNWNVRNSCSYVATTTKIRFHFQFPRSPDATFGGLIWWLFNWKCKCSCRMISNIANYLKYSYFWDGDGIHYVTLRLWTFSDFSPRHIVGVAGDDIMFHILVISVSAAAYNASKSSQAIRLTTFKYHSLHSNYISSNIHKTAGHVIHRCWP